MVTGFSQESSEADADAEPDEEYSMDALLSMSLEDLLNIELKTGSFLSLDLKSSSVSMTIISDKQLEASGARNLSEALEIYVPGFQYMINKWNGIIWGMRGVATDRNTKFIFLVNGHKMNTESRDGAMTELDLGLLEDVARIEILRGPAGLVYGSGAIAGVINVVTKEFEKNSVSISSKLSAWDSDAIGYEVQGSAAVKITEDANVRLDIGYRESDGIGRDRSLLWGLPHWPYQTSNYKEEFKNSGMPTLASAHGTPGNYKLAADINYKNLRIYSRYTSQTTNAGAWFFDANTRTSEPYNREYVQNNLSNQATYKLPVGENEVLFRGGFDANSNDINVLLSDSTEVTNPGGTESFGERRYNASVTYLFTSKDKFQFGAGYEYRLYDIGEGLGGKNEYNKNPQHLVVSNVMYHYNSIFTEGIYKFTEKLSTHFGLRYDLHTRTIQHGGVLSPKIGFVYQPNDNHSIKLVYQQSANNGTADSYEPNRNSIRPDGVVMEGYHYTNPLSHNSWELVPDASREVLDELKPETTRSIELMTYHQLGKHFIVLPSFSYNSISDLFVWKNDLSRMVNAGNYNFINIDLDLQYSSDKLSLGMNHTLQQLVGMDVKDQEYIFVGKEKDHDEEVTGNDGLTYYTPIMSEEPDTIVYNSIRDLITVDGQNFINLNTNVSKLYVDYQPLKWLSCHASARVFWGLVGRSPMHDFDYEAYEAAVAAGTESDTDLVLEDYVDSYFMNINDYEFKDIHAQASVKFNLGLTFGKEGFPLKASVYVYDLLAGDADNNNVNNLRWNASLEPYYLDLHGVDYRSYAFKLIYQL